MRTGRDPMPARAAEGQRSFARRLRRLSAAAARTPCERRQAMCGNSSSIVHVARSPVGGIFRHIADLATAQHAAGHRRRADLRFRQRRRAGGRADRRARRRSWRSASARLPMAPLDRPGRPSGDAFACRAQLATHAPRRRACARREGRRLRPARRRSSSAARAAASPPSTRRMAAACTTTRHRSSGRLYFAVERALERLTDGLIHVSAYEAETYRAEGRRAALPRACRAERPAAGGIRAGRAGAATPPTFSSSASCAT